MSRRTHRVKLPKPKWRSAKLSWNRSQDFQYVWETPKLFSPEIPSYITWTYGIEPRRNPGKKSLTESIRDDFFLSELKTLKQKVQQMESQLRANSTAPSQPASPNENENDSGDSYV